VRIHSRIKTLYTYCYYYNKRYYIETPYSEIDIFPPLQGWDIVVYDVTCSRGANVPVSSSNKYVDGCANQLLLLPSGETRSYFVTDILDPVHIGVRHCFTLVTDGQSLVRHSLLLGVAHTTRTRFRRVLFRHFLDRDAFHLSLVRQQRHEPAERPRVQVETPVWTTSSAPSLSLRRPGRLCGCRTGPHYNCSNIFLTHCPTRTRCCESVWK
jgi:hypothetical protein